jgi:hypothetical protein
MVLTRRLYELQEVKAAFRVCLRMGRVTECFFWLEELELSCEEDIIKEVLLEVWAMRKGIAWWSWLSAWAKYKDSCAGRRSLVHSFCVHEKQKLDCSLWLAYWLGLWKRSTGKDPEQYRYILNALGSSNLEECIRWWLIKLSPQISSLSFTLTEWSIEDAEKSLKGQLRTSRLFEIPFTAHLGWTERGFTKKTSMPQTDLYSLLSSPIWAGLLDEYITEEYEWKSDHSKEEFYDTYFGPLEDIPDEWTKQEKEKSHGLPPNHRRHTFRLRFWWKQWIPEEHRYIFGEPLRNLEKGLERDISVPIDEVLRGILPCEEVWKKRRRNFILEE